jgi:hypothetical protein
MFLTHILPVLALLVGAMVASDSNVGGPLILPVPSITTTAIQSTSTREPLLATPYISSYGVRDEDLPTRQCYYKVAYQAVSIKFLWAVCTAPNDTFVSALSEGYASFPFTDKVISDIKQFTYGVLLSMPMYAGIIEWRPFLNGVNPDPALTSTSTFVTSVKISLAAPSEVAVREKRELLSIGLDIEKLRKHAGFITDAVKIRVEIITSEEIKETRTVFCNAIGNGKVGPVIVSEKKNALQEKLSIILSDGTGVETA